MTSALQFNLEFSPAAMPGSYEQRGYYQAQRVSGPSRGSVHDFAVALRQKGFGKCLSAGDLVFYHVLGDTRFQIASDEPIAQLANVPIIGVDVRPLDNTMNAASAADTTAAGAAQDAVVVTHPQVAARHHNAGLDSQHAAANAANAAADRAAQIAAENAAQVSLGSADLTSVDPSSTAPDLVGSSLAGRPVEHPRHVKFAAAPAAPSTLHSHPDLRCQNAGGAMSYSQAARYAASGTPGGAPPFPDPFPHLPRDLSSGPPADLSRPQQLDFLESFPHAARYAACIGPTHQCRAWRKTASEDNRLLPAADPAGGCASYRCRVCSIKKWPYMYGEQHDRLQQGNAVCDRCLKTLKCSSCEKVKRPSQFSFTQKCLHSDRRCTDCIETAVANKEAADKAASILRKQTAAALVVQAAWRASEASWQHNVDWQAAEDAKAAKEAEEAEAIRQEDFVFE